MLTLAQSEGTHDIYLDDDGQLATASDADAYAIVISDAIRTLRGEIQLNTKLGIPYLETIFLNQSGVQIWKHYVVQRILEFDFVDNVDRFDYYIDFKSRVLTYEMEISTNSGKVSVRADDPYPAGTGGEGSDMSSFVQNGEFYLPVYKDGNGVQHYRKLTQYVDEYGVSTQISQEVYVKVDGVFVIAS